MMHQKPHKYISDTPTGRRAAIRLGGVLHTKRFPRGTALSDINDWVAREKVAYRAATAAVAPGTMGEAARRYLEAVAGMPTYAQRKQHVALWVAAFGAERERSTIAAADIAAVLQRWRLAACAPATLNKRRAALMHLFHVLDGKTNRNPVRDTPRFREPDATPRGVDMRVLARILASMRPSASRARLTVLLWTGWPPSTLKRVTPACVDLTAKTALMPGRQKGRGTKARPVPLLPQAVRAFQELTREEAWGDAWQTTALNKVFVRARKRYAEAHPDETVPPVTLYTLRHSFGTLAYHTTGDIRATQELMGHSSPTLTHRYTLAAVPPRLQMAIEAMRKGAR